MLPALIGWWDPDARLGLLEPVGARSSYRRLGLTKALIQETLRRFQELGADRGYVNSLAQDVASNALYRSAGYDDDAVEKVTHRNWLRVLGQTWQG